MPIYLEFTLSFKDYLQAQRNHAKRSWWLRFNNFAARRLNPALGVVILILAVLISGPHVSWTAPYLLMIFCAIVLLCYPFYLRIRLWKCYSRTRIDDGNLKLDLSGEGIHSESSNTKTDIAWNAVQSFAEDKHLFMLYLAPAKFIAIPKRICTVQQIDDLRILFQRYIRPKDA
jgi:YcxB-like protein